MIDILFVLLSFFVIIFAIGMVSFTQPIYSAICFIAVIVGISGLYALLGATFLFMVQLIVYAGAVITLLLFIIMFLNVKDENLPDEKNRFSMMIPAFVVLIPFNLVVMRAMSVLEHKDLSAIDAKLGSMKDVGKALFENWLLPFELISILLLVALIGSIALAMRSRS